MDRFHKLNEVEASVLLKKGPRGPIPGNTRKIRRQVSTCVANVMPPFFSPMTNFPPIVVGPPLTKRLRGAFKG